jgi:hypothetical protein
VAISSARARQICTKAELDLVLQSTTIHIGNLDAKQLKAAIRRARTLRDKWRDLAHAQTRDTKATSPEQLGEANARSAEKGVLFDETLARFEKRLSKVDTSPTVGSASSKASSKVNHRADRATVRETLNAKTEMLNASSSPTPAKKVATKKAATKKAATKSPASKPVASKKAAPKKKTAKKPPTRKAGAVSTKGVAAAELASGRPAVASAKLTGADKKRNLKAKTSAKATAVARSGAPRIQGHVSSQGRRNQAKRNTR